MNPPPKALLAIILPLGAAAIGAVVAEIVSVGDCGIARGIMALLGWTIGGGCGLSALLLIRKVKAARFLLGLFLYLVAGVISLFATVDLLDAGAGIISLVALLIATFAAAAIGHFGSRNLKPEEPNNSLVPTPASVTPTAGAHGAPPSGAADN